MMAEIWRKCSIELPEDGLLCWVCDREKNVFGALFRKEQKRNHWSPIEYYTTIEPMFETDESNEHFVFLDEALYWMPYTCPEPPLDFQIPDELSGWITDRLPEYNQPCKFIKHGCIFVGRHGANGAFEGIYTHHDGRKVKTIEANIHGWKPL